ncbi:hypothetical protein EVAR_28450_1 [Eumeta japonica]|uniref:Uncharacterized protein n=1 Tax=Eumeta variegata TaxID=151549 RepID=A0A4C1VBJ5_EUMVA|nr:hypothetical protein EVAR_28450_1 [Eumeta japonica]
MESNTTKIKLGVPTPHGLGAGASLAEGLLRGTVDRNSHCIARRQTSRHRPRGAGRAMSQETSRINHRELPGFPQRPAPQRRPVV